MREPHVPWDVFERGLAEVLGSFEERTFLIISWVREGSVYAQFSVNLDGGVHAETVSDEFLPAGRQLGLAGADQMKALGWVPPVVNPAGWNNWRIDLPWPATTADLRRVGHKTVTALRDVHGVPSPQELKYKAWQEGETPPVGEYFEPEDLAPRVPHLDLPALGIPADH